MESIESISQNTDNDNINEEGQKLIDEKFEEIWTMKRTY